MLFFFNDTATTEIYTLSLHDALPISVLAHCHPIGIVALALVGLVVAPFALLASECDGDSNVSAGHCEIPAWWLIRSEEHTSELQSRLHLVCRLLLEKKKIVQPTFKLP